MIFVEGLFDYSVSAKSFGLLFYLWSLARCLGHITCIHRLGLHSKNTNSINYFNALLNNATKVVKNSLPCLGPTLNSCHQMKQPTNSRVTNNHLYNVIIVQPPNRIIKPALSLLYFTLLPEQPPHPPQYAVLLGIVRVVFAGDLEDGREGGRVRVDAVSDLLGDLDRNKQMR